MNDHSFEQLSVSSFSYIAHPPLIVAAIACSAMIEEVGATYVNAYVNGKSHDLENTSPNRILEDVEEYYGKSDNYDTEKIGELVIRARNEISHYVTERGEAITLHEFEEFCEAIIEGIGLVEEMLVDLLHKPIEEFHGSFEQLSY